VASRQDAKANYFEHTYDALGRRIETRIDDSDWYEQEPDPPPDGGAPHRVRLRAGWQAVGLSRVTTIHDDGAPHRILRPLGIGQAHQPVEVVSRPWAARRGSAGG
jgi:hypothetical protein